MAQQHSGQLTGWIGWAPLLLFVSGCVVARSWLLPWQLMWTLAFALFIGLKWMTWWAARETVPHSTLRSAGYLLAWPGMDAAFFLDERRHGPTPSARVWISGILKTVLGGALIWVVARRVPASHALIRGWIGMVGLILMLHFGSFEVWCHLWQISGVDARRVMNQPLSSTSLAEFWGRRWNTPFRQLMHDLIFRPTARRWNPNLAGFLAFLASGLIHDFVISFPAGGGYGLPTAYFVLQGLGVMVERSKVGKRAAIDHGTRGWMFMLVFTAGPVMLLFHRPFVTRVVLPFMSVIHAL